MGRQPHSMAKILHQQFCQETNRPHHNLSTMIRIHKSLQVLFSGKVYQFNSNFYNKVWVRQPAAMKQDLVRLERVQDVEYQDLAFRRLGLYRYWHRRRNERMETRKRKCGMAMFLLENVIHRETHTPVKKIC